MARVCFILVAGLNQPLLSKAGSAHLDDFAFRAALRPVLPAVTCSMQATLTTGVAPNRHGIVSNGLYAYGDVHLQSLIDTGSFADFRRQISFWEQSADLLLAPRFWHGRGWKTAMLFWQQSIPGERAENAADIVLTPKPEHTPDGKTLTACWSQPGDLYAKLVGELGPFPLHQYWGPMASLPSSAWIINSARSIWRREIPDLQLVYIPHLDYNLQRLGPDHPLIQRDWADLVKILEPLVQDVRRDGGAVILAGDYGMNAVSRAVLPNLVLRRNGLLKTRADEQGKQLIDFTASRAVAMVDHQVAHIYGSRDEMTGVADMLRQIPGVAAVLEKPEEIAAEGLGGARTGTLVLLADADAWFAHDWWDSDAEKPAWQFSVDIHRKPGYDPRELFFDPVKKCITQDTMLVKGSHGLRSLDAANWPVLLSDRKIALDGAAMHAENVASWINGLMESR